MREWSGMWINVHRPLVAYTTKWRGEMTLLLASDRHSRRARIDVLSENYFIFTIRLIQMCNAFLGFTAIFRSRNVVVD